jgi:hypothetical protein
MEPDKTPNNPANHAQTLSDQLIEILLEVREHAGNSNNLLWSYYESIDEMIKDIDQHIEGVKLLDMGRITMINVLFLPTGDFQTVAIDNGWSNEYLVLASRFDKVYADFLKLLKARST